MLYRAAVVILFLAAAFRRQDAAWFGYYHDDTLYLASARALARGEGYTIPSLPGAPAQTKYPVLYPLLLAGVWKAEPRFPENLVLALGLTTLCGAALAAGWHALLEQLGATPREAAALGALSALHPFTLSLSGAVLSDAPFLALAVWAVVLAARGAWRGAAACSAAAVLTRSIGLAVAVGLVVFACARRDRRGAVWSAAAVPVFAAWAWWAGAHRAALEGLPGYRQTMLFYTDYLGFWRASVPDLATLGTLAANNALEILKAPAALCFPLPHLPDQPWVQGAGAMALTAAIVAGVVRLPRHPVRLALIFYTAVTLLWNYPLANRFLVLFLPVFWLGALRTAQALPRRRLLVPLGALLAFESCYANLWLIPNQMTAVAEDRRALAAEKAEAYAWIASRTAPSDRFIAYEDALLYLHTGRQAMRPIALTSPPRPDLGILGDVARQVGARFWVVCADDYQLEEAAGALTGATRRLLQHAPPVFRSRGGRVWIRSLP